ncbi:hypothetical protein JOD54_005355 [Actinokineospora baliensis]|uniref:hypothetical protein n=1 Tax=Actinokineospora baliensis TaxID=547056 RepID=UPI00195E24C3|nr:hypothetical protein [Actinokineospora baliensis]MBM7775151.1 hypothetical protein [Actinokineospora baliensis]
MKGFHQMAAAVVVAGMAMVSVVPEAAAATGIFLYYEPDGGLGIVDPDDDWCYPLGFTVRHLDNDTNRTALLFDNNDCLGLPSATMRPRTMRDSPGYVSVVFHRTSNTRCVTVKDDGDRHCN